MTNPYRPSKKYWTLLLLLALVGSLVHMGFWSIPYESLKEQDIFYTWLEGKRIIAGENPYGRVLASDMRVNDKYATYFPLAYLASALLQKFGLSDFRDWLDLWRPISLSFHIGIVALTLKHFEGRGLWMLGFASSVVLLLGRWSLYIIRVHHLEFAAIFFLLLSLVLLNSKKRIALLMFSISLGIKQIAIFLLPLYLIHIWKRRDNLRPSKALLLDIFTILSVPLITSLPFLAWNTEGFFKSILFSATRLADLHVGSAPSIDALLSAEFSWIEGLKSRLPMLFLMGMVYFSSLKENISMFTSSAMVMMIFLYFNSVLFLQYFLWPLCLIPFALVESIPFSYSQGRQQQR